jgi:hypothetical protein
VSPRRLSSFVLRTFLPPGTLLGLTDEVKSGTLYSIKAQWACLPVPVQRILFGDSERSANKNLTRQPDAIRLDHRRSARSLKTRTRPVRDEWSWPSTRCDGRPVTCAHRTRFSHLRADLVSKVISHKVTNVTRHKATRLHSSGEYVPRKPLQPDYLR